MLQASRTDKPPCALAAAGWALCRSANWTSRCRSRVGVVASPGMVSVAGGACQSRRGGDQRHPDPPRSAPQPARRAASSSTPTTGSSACRCSDHAGGRSSSRPRPSSALHRGCWPTGATCAYLGLGTQAIPLDEARSRLITMRARRSGSAFAGATPPPPPMPTALGSRALRG